MDRDVWHLFASLGLERWLEFNLKRYAIGTLRWDWAILFSSMIHMLWIDRNHFVFSRKSALLDLFLPKLFGQVEALETHLRKPVPSFIDASVEVSVR